MNEARLIEKLRKVEQLFAGATTAGEEAAAGYARQKILERLRRLQATERELEFRFTMADMWQRKVFVSLLRRYDLEPYRYRRQRRTTVMVRTTRSFIDKTLWPEFVQFSDLLASYLSEVTERVVSQVLHADSSEPSAR